MASNDPLKELQAIVSKIQTLDSVGFNTWQDFGEAHRKAFSVIHNDEGQWQVFVDLTNNALDKTRESNRLSGATKVSVAANTPDRILEEVTDRKILVAEQMIRRGMGDMLSQEDREAATPQWTPPSLKR